MKFSDWSKELPPKFDYTGKTPVERDLCIQLWMEDIKDEFALFKRTRNGAHMWRCYQLWRRLMPDDLPLPRGLLAYLDDCADAVATETDPAALKLAMKLVQSPEPANPEDKAEHGGGHSGATAAEPPRKQRNAMEFIRSELFSAEIKGETAPGYKTAIYKAAADRFGYSLPSIYRLLHDWPVGEMVESDLRKWRERQK